MSARETRALGLTRTLPRAYARVCRAQAAHAPPDVRGCPPLIPEAALAVTTSGPFSRQARYRGGFTANYARGGGLNGGHIVYVWDRGRATFVVSVHGYANEPRARAMMLALIAQRLGSSVG